MMIHLSESQVFKGKMPQALYSLIGRKLAPSDLLEEFADGIGVQSSTQPVSIQPTRV